MLERRAVKVACVVLRGLGEGDLAWLPGALKAMTRYTVLADIAGQVARTTNTPRVTVAGVSVRTEEASRIRALLPYDLPKWGQSSLEHAERITEILAAEAVAVSALSLNRDTPEWVKFWDESEKLRKEITKQDGKKVGFAKAPNVARYFLFGWAVTVATAYAVKIAPRTRVVDWQGLEIIEQTVICDADLSGQETTDLFRRFWMERGHQPRIKSMGFKFITRDVTLATEQDEPLLLLADYSAGLVHCSLIQNPARIRLPLTQQQAHRCVTRIDTLGKAEIYSGNFNLEFREIFGEVMNEAGI
jgi:hypothetical protein